MHDPSNKPNDEHPTGLVRLRQSISSERASVVAALIAGVFTLAASLFDVTGIDHFFPDQFRNIGLPIILSLVAAVLAYYVAKGRGG
jgi:hypothetical protein